MPFRKRFFCVFSLLFLLGLVTGCGKNKNFDNEYFAGLQKLADGKEDEARTKFNLCIKKGSPVFARESAKELTTFGSLQEKTKACKNLLNAYRDSETKLIAARHYQSAGETGLVIEATYGLDYAEENNELIKIRLECLKERDTSHYDSEVFKWFTLRPLTDYHYKFYKNSYCQNKAPEEMTPEEFAIDYRIDIYKRNYLAAYDNAFTLFRFFNENQLEPLPQLVSDIGKSFLYGSSDFSNNAFLLCEKAQQYNNTEAEFYFWFYAGRLYSKAGLYFKQAINCFEKAAVCTNDANKRDNALWYLLDTSLTSSIDFTINKLIQYADVWSDPQYFDDFFEKFIPALVEKGKWNSFAELLKILDGYASKKVTAKIAYIYGRLIQENKIQVENPQGETKRAFEKALDSGTDEYYRILAAYQLGLQGKELINNLCIWSELKPRNFEIDEKSENLLRGYATFGFPERIYPAWVELNKKGISTETSMYLADFLHRCGNSNNLYNVQSLRIAAKAGLQSERPLTKEELMLIYPKNFSIFVDNYSEKYDIASSVVYALIRSESFFDADVKSSAGAIGLTQLMEFTAGDIARKLRMQDYSLTDAETNIEFGTFYLSELVRRCNNSYLQALFSYNAGITRVRRWLASSMPEYGKKQNLSGDLFLETVPYEETRNYGRKLLPATVMYEWLYSDAHIFAPVVENFID